ncbi:MAG: nitrite/sulfite reductase, partial [Spirochaetia bacterium]|nr:nitrite/sulfite reductase [Spirochaetia bacterium]
MSAYALPDSVKKDLETFSAQCNDFNSGKIDSLLFKTFRVPFGIYEQREAGSYMVRVRPAAGILTPRQLSVLAGLAADYAQPRLHVTTRGGVQLHNIKPDDFLPVMEALHSAGLTGRGGGGNTVRNIVCDPYSGTAADETFDVTPHVLALTNKMLEQKDSYSLPRKYKIAFSSSPADRALALFADLGFIAKVSDGRRGFRVFTAGGLGNQSKTARPFADFIPEDEIFLIAQSIKKVFDEKGNRRNKNAARLRFLAEELGFDVFEKLVHEKMHLLRSEGGWRLEINELPQIEPDRQDAAVNGLSEDEKLWRSRFVFSQKQNGYYSAKLPLLLGDISAAKAAELAAALEKIPRETIRLCNDQNVIIRNLKPAELAALYPLFKEISPLVSKAALIGNIIVCTGAATCQLGITIPRGALGAIEKALAGAGIPLDELNGFKINISGCPNSCGRHETADLGFSGKALREGDSPYPAYNIFGGARFGENAARLGKKISDI